LWLQPNKDTSKHKIKKAVRRFAIKIASVLDTESPRALEGAILFGKVLNMQY
jgi:hypothetical protein